MSVLRIDMPVPLPIIQSLRLFDTLPPAEQAELASHLSLRSAQRREVVIKQGQSNAGLGFLVEGRLQLVDFTIDGKEVGINFVDERDFFGELSVIDRQPAAEYVIAVAPSRILFVEQERARELMFGTPAAAEAIARRLAQRLRQTTRQRALLALPSSSQRVCAQLLMLVQNSGESLAEIDRPPTHQEIAIMINTSRETVTRALQQLQGLKVVARVGNKLVVHRIDLLKQAADGKISIGK